jgi:hypothetical protein
MIVGMLETRPPLPAQPHPAPKARSRPHARNRAETAAPLAAIHVLILAWLAHLLTLADLLQAARSLTPRHTPHPCFELDETEPQPDDAAILSRELMSLLRILYRIGARPARGMRALPSSTPTPRHTPPIRPPPARPPARTMREPRRLRTT